MLIYEKKVEENDELVRRLFGTMGDIPSDDDEQLTYKDNDGDTITVEPTDLYVDGGCSEGKQFIKRIYQEDDETKEELLNVFIGDTCVIGEVAEKEVKSIRVKTKPTKLTYAVNDTLDLTGMVVQATYMDGDKEEVDGYTTDPADGATLDTAGSVTVTVTYEEKTTTFKVTVE